MQTAFWVGDLMTGNFGKSSMLMTSLDLDKAMSLIPGKYRVNFHASYAETEGNRER